ncbi:MAG: tetratricopeptide repeat protein [bacterium]
MSNDTKRKLNNLFAPSRCQTFEQLAQYAENRLAPPERFAVEKHLLECELCSDVVEGLASTEGADEVQHHIKTLNRRFLSQSRSAATKRSTRQFYYAIAAVVLLGICTSLFVWHKSSSPQSLFADFYKPYPNTIPILRGADADSLLPRMAMMFYEKKEYGEALNLLQHILKTDAENSFAHFYSGNILLLIDEPAPAIPHFQSVLQQQKSKFSEPAEWYLGLAYLKMKEVDRAKAILAQISSKNGKYKQQGSELLARLNR